MQLETSKNAKGGEEGGRYPQILGSGINARPLTSRKTTRLVPAAVEYLYGADSMVHHARRRVLRLYSEGSGLHGYSSTYSEGSRLQGYSSTYSEGRLTNSIASSFWVLAILWPTSTSAVVKTGSRHTGGLTWS